MPPTASIITIVICALLLYFLLKMCIRDRMTTSIGMPIIGSMSMDTPRQMRSALRQS